MRGNAERSPTILSPMQSRLCMPYYCTDSLWIIHVFAPPSRRFDTCTIYIHMSARAHCVNMRVVSVFFFSHGRRLTFFVRGAATDTSTLSHARASVRTNQRAGYLCGVTCVREVERRNGIFDGTRSLKENETRLTSRCKRNIMLLCGRNLKKILRKFLN